MPTIRHESRPVARPERGAYRWAVATCECGWSDDANDDVRAVQRHAKRHAVARRHRTRVIVTGSTIYHGEEL